MTTVEAMSFGAVPLAFNDGGQREIIQAAHGVLWNTVDELVHESVRLAHSPAELDEQARAAVAASQPYDRSIFAKRCVDYFL
jgi:hypothetical protein